MPDDAGLDIDFDAELAKLQGESAGVAQPPEGAEVEVAGTVVTSDRTVEFMDRRFRISDRIGLMPLLKFSAHSDMRTDDPGALAAMYAMLRDCIHPGSPGCGTCQACQDDDERSCKDYDPGDWAAFERHAIDCKAEADDLLNVISDAIGLIAGRPTEPPSGSSPGRHAIQAGSTARSSARAPRGSRR